MRFTTVLLATLAAVAYADPAAAPEPTAAALIENAQLEAREPGKKTTTRGNRCKKLPVKHCNAHGLNKDCPCTVVQALGQVTVTGTCGLPVGATVSACILPSPL